MSDNNGKTYAKMSGEEVTAQLPPRNPGLALLANGRWYRNRKKARYELTATVHRLGAIIPIKLGSVPSGIYHGPGGDEARENVARRALKRHLNLADSWIEAKIRESSIFGSDGRPTS